MILEAYKTSSLHFIFLLQREGAAPVTVVDRGMSPNVPDKMSPVKSTRFRDDILLLLESFYFQDPLGSFFTECLPRKWFP